MIGHDDPCVKTIPGSVEVEQRILDSDRYCRVLEPTATMPGVQRHLNPADTLIVDVCTVDRTQLLMPISQHVRGEAIFQSNDHMLRCTLCTPVFYVLVAGRTKA